MGKAGCSGTRVHNTSGSIREGGSGDKGITGRSLGTPQEQMAVHQNKVEGEDPILGLSFDLHVPTMPHTCTYAHILILTYSHSHTHSFSNSNPISHKLTCPIDTHVFTVTYTLSNTHTQSHTHT